MNEKKSNVLLLIVFSIFIIYQTIWPSKDSMSSNILGISINIASAIILLILLHMLQNINRLKLYFTTKIIYRNKSVRLSISYLFRIKINDKYLLVKSRTRNHYQPVGGAYKSLPGSEMFFNDLEIGSDRIISNDDGIAKGDLRVYVAGKNILSFLDWFESKKDREISPWREFCEELITSEILPFETFHSIDYRFMKTIRTPVIKLDHGDLGLYQYDIYDLLPTTTQLNYFEELQKSGDKSSYIWASEYHIKRLGHDESSMKFLYNIGKHAKWALELKWTKT